LIDFHSYTTREKKEIVLSVLSKHKYGITQSRLLELLDKRSCGGSHYSIKKLLNELINDDKILMINYNHVYVYKVKT